MLSANTLPTTIVRFTERLPIINIDLSRFARTDSRMDVALHIAYTKFKQSYGNRADSFFDEDFLAGDDDASIEAFANGWIARHEAAVHLAHAWDSRLSPVRSAARKRRIVDATMAADSLLSLYETELASER